MEIVAHLALVFMPFVFFGACVLWHSRAVRRVLTTSEGRPIAHVFDDVVREASRTHRLSSPPP